MTTRPLDGCWCRRMSSRHDVRGLGGPCSLSWCPGPPHSEHEALASETQANPPPCLERLFSAASAAPSTTTVILLVSLFSVLGGLPSNVRAAQALSLAVWPPDHSPRGLAQNQTQDTQPLPVVPPRMNDLKRAPQLPLLSESAKPHRPSVFSDAYIFPRLRGRVDYRLLSYGIHRHVLDAAKLPPLLRTVRGALFPGNMPAGKSTLVAPSSDAELRALKRRCASALWALVPKGVGRLYFGGGLLRASPVSRRARQDKTEGSAELKTAASTIDKGKNDGDRGRGRWPSSLSTTPTTTAARGEAGKATRGVDETATNTDRTPATRAQTRGQEASRSAATVTGGAASRSRRSAPAPRPKTGGQGQGGGAPPNVHASASTAAANVELSASGGAAVNVMASSPSRGDEKGGDRDNHDADDQDTVDDRDGEILDEIERGILDVFGDAYCNKHLVYGILELVLVRLLPELAEKGVLELWGERIPVGGGDGSSDGGNIVL